MAGDFDDQDTESNERGDYIDAVDDIDHSLDLDERDGRLSRKQNDLVSDEELGAGLDPVKAYLREMGAVPLLSSEDETAIAKRIEKGDRQVQRALFSLPMTIKKLQVFRQMIEEGKVVSDILRGLDESESDEEALLQAREKFLWKISEAERLE
ncbi:MAG: hypothetical protein PF568_00300, partial [Deltaproteobacteria bacterium]|nr:hypothetical protein [Deltaproteobacteria bacterium]